MAFQNTKSGYSCNCDQIDTSSFCTLGIRQQVQVSKKLETKNKQLKFSIVLCRGTLQYSCDHKEVLSSKD